MMICKVCGREVKMSQESVWYVNGDRAHRICEMPVYVPKVKAKPEGVNWSVRGDEYLGVRRKKKEKWIFPREQFVKGGSNG